MKVVEYADVPAIFDQLLEEVELQGATIEIHKDGRPIGRLGPVDEATKSRFKSGGIPEA